MYRQVWIIFKRKYIVFVRKQLLLLKSAKFFSFHKHDKKMMFQAVFEYKSYVSKLFSCIYNIENIIQIEILRFKTNLNITSSVEACYVKSTRFKKKNVLARLIISFVYQPSARLFLFHSIYWIQLLLFLHNIFIVSNIKYYICLQDPNTNKIKQILGARDITGVVTNYLEVDSQPVLGDWKIKVTAHVSLLLDIIIHVHIIHTQSWGFF